MMTSSFIPDMLQTDKDLCFLSPKAHQSGIWHLGTYFVVIGHIASKREKTCHGSSNDDVINLKAMIERYTFSSIL